ncbi:MAG: hypothetical protein EOO67_09475, partial [Microbacterium sp.]
PEVLEHDGVTTLVYSASGSWTEDYCLGTLTSDGGPVLDPATWTKSDGCVFSKRDTAWGPGHHTFTTSPDGTEDWIVYHASTVKDRGWDGRTIRAQRFTWGDGGRPEFGTPVATYETVTLPSGDRTQAQATYEAEDAEVNRARIVDVRYSNGIGSTSTHLLSVNGGDATEVELPSNGWDNWLFTGVDVDLKAGENTIRLSKGAGYAELDLIRVDARPLDDGAEAVPSSGVLSSDNGWDTGLRDGDYTVSMDLWWGENASSFRLYENGSLISTTRLVPDSPRAQHVEVPVSGRPNGTYTYTGELLNSRGVTKTAPLKVAVTDAAPGRPTLSHDNHDRDGTFVVTADLWWGTNATEYVFFADGVEVASGSLTAATPKAQRATLQVEGAAPGVHRYEVEFRNAAGATRSAPLAVTVRR